jgi:hypothetical protein
VSDAASVDGHAAGCIPPSAAAGSHGQLCCGENEIVIVQLCWGARSNEAPRELAQLSCSVKFGSPLKSLSPNMLVAPDCGLNASETPLSGAFKTLVLVSVIVCVVGADPSSWAGKVSDAGEIVIG